MRLRWLWVPLFLCGLCSPATADNRIIVRTTLGLQGLQQFCSGLPLLQNCTVVRSLDDPLGQLFLITTPAWYIIPSSTPTNFTITQWGLPTDIPIQKPVAE